VLGARLPHLHCLIMRRWRKQPPGSRWESRVGDWLFERCFTNGLNPHQARLSWRYCWSALTTPPPLPPMHLCRESWSLSFSKLIKFCYALALSLRNDLYVVYNLNSKGKTPIYPRSTDNDATKCLQLLHCYDLLQLNVH